MRVTEFFQVLPAAVRHGGGHAVLALARHAGHRQSWPATARLTRAEFLRIRQLEFVRASARATAASSGR
jgi:peptide/nickel transport system permease protein